MDQPDYRNHADIVRSMSAVPGAVCAAPRPCLSRPLWVIDVATSTAFGVVGVEFAKPERNLILRALWPMRQTPAQTPAGYRQPRAHGGGPELPAGRWAPRAGRAPSPPAAWLHRLLPQQHISAQASNPVAQPVWLGQDQGCEGPWVEVAVWSTRLRTRSGP